MSKIVFNALLKVDGLKELAYALQNPLKDYKNVEINLISERVSIFGCDSIFLDKEDASDIINNIKERIKKGWKILQSSSKATINYYLKSEYYVNVSDCYCENNNCDCVKIYKTRFHDRYDDYEIEYKTALEISFSNKRIDIFKLLFNSGLDQSKYFKYVALDEKYFDYDIERARITGIYHKIPVLMMLYRSNYSDEIIEKIDLDSVYRDRYLQVWPEDDLYRYSRDELDGHYFTLIQAIIISINKSNADESKGLRIIEKIIKTGRVKNKLSSYGWTDLDMAHHYKYGGLFSLLKEYGIKSSLVL